MIAIDRGEAMNLLNEAQVEYDENYKGLGLAKKIIGDMKPVELERPKGEWVKYSIPRCGEQHYKCSHCDEYVNFGLYGDFYTKDFIYCPHCGADMRGVN